MAMFFISERNGRGTTPSMEQAMKIRAMARTDINAVTMLMNELNLELGEAGYINEKTMHEHYEAMQMNSEMYLNLVLEMDKEIIGFMSLLFYRSFLHHKGTALINELIVKKEFRDRNYGKELLNHGIRKARESGLDEVEVGVMKENVKALDFYKRNGMNLEYHLLGMEF
jgi:ribosomal protein S18 acetylase RimI-like enzyme